MPEKQLLSKPSQMVHSNKILFQPLDSIITKLKKVKLKNNQGKISMKLWDLGGQARFRESWEKFCRDSDVIIFVVDSYDQSKLFVII
jgi:GTPase SAR1 family protein